MSVYQQGDKARERDGDGKKKKDIGDEIGAAVENFAKDFSKGFNSMFGGGKEKKWTKKGEGHTLGTAADDEARRQARLAALEANGAGSSSAAATPRQPAPARPASGAAASAVAAAEARAKGVTGAAARPRAPVPPGVSKAAEPAARSSFPGQGHLAAPPESAYAAQIQMLREMGFEGGAATRALEKSSGDVERAVELLSPTDGGAAAAAPPPEVGVASPWVLSAAAEVGAPDAPALAAALSGMRGGGAALGLIRKLVGNVRDAPSDSKFRRVRLTNPKIAATLAGRVEALCLLSACGFALGASGEAAEMTDASAADAAALEAACGVLDDAIACAAAGGPPVPVGPTDIKVLVPSEGRPMTFDEVSDDFYQISGAEAKAIMEMNAARRKDEETLKTREQREAEVAVAPAPARMPRVRASMRAIVRDRGAVLTGAAMPSARRAPSQAARKKRVYRKAMIRVRFPDGVVLQATFSSAATVGAVLQWVEGSLRCPGHAFELSVARGSALSDLGLTLEQAELAPAALLNFRCPTAEQVQPPYLSASLMASVQELGSEAIPEGILLGGAGERSFQEAALAAGPGRVRPEAGGAARTPKWMMKR